MSHARGSVIVESALTLTIILFVLYGTLQLGIVGLEQLTVDGGAFTYAHQQSFAGGKATYATGQDVTQSTFKHLVSANVQMSANNGEPPTTAFAGQYGFNTPNARYGGVSLIQPVQTTATITRNNIPNLVLGVAGKTLSVTGIAVEPAYRLINGHGNVSGNSFNSAGAFTTAADPFSASSPPYFVGFAYMQSCPYYLPPNQQTGWTNCPNGTLVSSIGSAEYLDAHNWSRQTNGVTPSPQAVFWETRYHQTLFATISQQLALANSATNPFTAKAAILDPLARTPASAYAVACVYSFDNDSIGAYASGSSGIGDPLFALHPEGTSPLCPAR